MRRAGEALTAIAAVLVAVFLVWAAVSFIEVFQAGVHVLELLTTTTTKEG